MLVNKSSLSNKRGARKFIKTSEAASNTAMLDTEKIEYDAKFDGYYAISFSDNNMSAKDIASAYHGLWQIEESFRTLKHFFEVRPMFHWTKKRIEGHIMLNFLLLVMEQFLISLVKENCNEEDSISHERIRAAIDHLDLSILTIGNAKFVSYAKIDPYQTMILKSLNIHIPKNQKILS